MHRKVIKGELWEKEAHVLPACVDCHQPHKIRKVFYTQGMADADCLKCHEREGPQGARTAGRCSWTTSEHQAVAPREGGLLAVPLGRQRLAHAGPARPSTQKVDCGACHTEVAQQYATQPATASSCSTATRTPRPARSATGRHGDARARSRRSSPTFATNVPTLCARCHREGETGGGALQGSRARDHRGLHGEHPRQGAAEERPHRDRHLHELPHRARRPAARPTRPRASTAPTCPQTCGRCHHGIQEEFEKSIHHDACWGKTDKELPVCNDCHSAHTIRRADADGFKLDIMQKCGRCHEEITKTYFDTYHGKVTQLGYTKTAKCYDCHGAHDIQPVADPRSHLSRENVVATCQKCHPGATRRFAGYLSHATHHDPEKYPWLFWTFWGMTGLLVGTFVIGGAHTLLWLPRAFQMRRELKEAEEAEERELEAQERARRRTGTRARRRPTRPSRGPTPSPRTRDSAMEGSARAGPCSSSASRRLNRALHVLMIVSFISPGPHRDDA